MKQLTWVIAVLMGIVLATASGAAAGHRAESFTVSPFIGGYVFDSDLNLDDAFTYGAGLGYNFTEHLAAEGVFNYTDADLENGSQSVDGYLYRLDALYHFMPDNRLVPYLAAGAGAFELDAGSAGDETEFSGNMGAGVKYFLNDWTALRADVRDVMTFPENNLLYTAGFTFYFGGPEKPAETVAAAATQEPVEKDSDGDGVYDRSDQCPETPAEAAVDNRGCAVDSDADGIADYMDECPDTVLGAGVDAQGCALDSDNDGIIDYHDECSSTPEGASVNDRGCWVVEDLQFEVGKAEIRPKYNDNLDAVVSILKRNPGIEVEIQGHTDNRGAAEMNRKLSERRAAAVYNYLIEKGIDADRLSYKGYGETDPVASNETAAGRAENRRVEIKPIY